MKLGKRILSIALNSKIKKTLKRFKQEDSKLLITGKLEDLNDLKITYTMKRRQAQKGA